MSAERSGQPMGRLVAEETFDAIAEHRDEFLLLFRLHSDAVVEFIDTDPASERFAKFNGEPRPDKHCYATSLAHVLNAMYLDVPLANMRIQSCLEEPLKARGNASGQDVRAFIIHGMRTCAQELKDEFKTKNADHHDPNCSVLCCGVLAGFALLLHSAIQSNLPTFTVPSELKDLIAKQLNLSTRFSNISLYLQAWIGNFWRAQEATSSFSQKTTGDGEVAFKIFWTMQILYLYEEIKNLIQARNWDDPFDVSDPQVRDVVDLKGGVARIAEAHVMAWIAGFHSRLVQGLSRDTLYWLLIYLMNSRKLECEDICTYVLDIVFEKFSANGCFLFAGSDPSAIVNLSNSTEVLAILLYCDLLRRVKLARQRTQQELARQRRQRGENQLAVSLGSLAPSLFAKRYKQVADQLSALKTVHDRRLWYTRPGAQSIDCHFWRLCLISCGILLVDELLDRHARTALRVDQFVPKPLGDYPAELQFLKKDVICLIRKGGEARKRASYSMIFYGPPGSAKTTLAKNIAYDLGWPFLEIGSRDFLREGTDQIDAQADRIFRYCGYLRDVVILFDELEELILEREIKGVDKASRLLTTSMLPRIQQLREQRSAVFIFATNRLESLDIAATRLGRFDIIKYVRYPDLNTKKGMLESEAKAVGDRYPVLRDALKVVMRRAEAELEYLTCNMAFGDLKYILGQVRKAAAKPVTDVETLAAEIVAIFLANKPGDEIQRRVAAFETLSARDRPPSRKPTDQYACNAGDEKTSSAGIAGQIATSSATAAADAANPKVK
jgi:hypothetical protein